MRCLNPEKSTKWDAVNCALYFGVKLLIELFSPSTAIRDAKLANLSHNRETAPCYKQSRPFFIAQGTFPTPLRLGGSAIGWLQADVQQWLQRRIDASQQRRQWHGEQLWGTTHFLN